MSTECRGIIASPGIRIGKAYLYKTTEIIIPKYTIKDEDVVSEIERFRNSIKKTKEEITSIQEQIASSLSSEMADIFTSHLMVLEDPLIIEKTIDKISSEKRNVEWIINDLTLELVQSLNTIKDDYIRERIIDLSDINKRLINNLQSRKTISPNDLKEEVILFSKDLSPSDTAMLNKDFILAFVTDKGGRTSHTAIMARALEIPAIVGSLDITSKVRDGDIVIVDALHGKVIIDPSEAEIKEYTKYREDLKRLDAELAELTHLPSKTLDENEIFIYGNIEIPEEMQIIKDHGAQGIGLFRSEFLFLDKSLPDEEMQFRGYRAVAEYFNPFPTVIRTLDVGGDKIYAYTNDYKERNPFLGCRAIRFSLQNEDLLRTQIRAILRASHYGNVKIMFPMITTVEELIKSKSITYECMNDLKKKGIPYDENIKIGIMIEVPSALINADILAKYADFFSVGTNDLVQYTLAVDRISEKIAYLYNPLNLSVLRLLKQLVDTSNRLSIPLSICGEMAGEPKYTMVLIGLGFREFSMSSAYMNQVKRIIRSVTGQECRELVDELMKCEKTHDIESKVFSLQKEKFPWLTL
ncbi:MAG TPA: phosphoenolpyruvate--protein phosphotransferase [Spirochaetota bacterium]|nr:phosphoenolpyruvate--protein phosphotransferase [Spirochaetota bacterium]HQO04062.1 phosphoenolpyruvate--protein phosphotransferase [Spirochaetota bacterium]HQP49747.1 phosphoenolpyruvate--protein phosphotransferase [Spirochaetota bacterium]